MALKDTWTPKTDDVDDVMASDINEVAAAIIELEKNGGSGSGGGGGMTEQEIRDLFADIIESRYVSATDTVSTPRIWMYNNNDWSGFTRVDADGNEITMEQTLATKSNELKLLNTFTVDEAVNYIEITQTDDGINYADLNIRKIQITTMGKKDTSQTANTGTKLYLDYGTAWEYSWTGATGAYIGHSADYYSFFEMDMDLKRIIFTASSPQCGYNGNMTISSNFEYSWSQMNSASNKGTLPILGVKWASDKSDINIMPGSVIRIWGC